MLTKQPNIVIAVLPKRTRPKARVAPAAVPKGPVIVEARDPRRISRDPKAALAPRVIGAGSKVAEMSEAERDRRADAADRLFQKIKRAAAKG